MGDSYIWLYFLLTFIAGGLSGFGVFLANQLSGEERQDSLAPLYTFFSNSGTELITLRPDDTVEVYSLSTAFDVSTASIIRVHSGPPGLLKKILKNGSDPFSLLPEAWPRE